MPMYNFDPAEEQDDLLEQELLDHGREGSLAGPNAKVRQRVFGKACTDIFSPISSHEQFISLVTVLSKSSHPQITQMVNSLTTTKAMITILIFLNRHKWKISEQ